MDRGPARVVARTRQRVHASGSPDLKKHQMRHFPDDSPGSLPSPGQPNQRRASIAFGSTMRRSGSVKTKASRRLSTAIPVRIPQNLELESETNKRVSSKDVPVAKSMKQPLRAIQNQMGDQRAIPVKVKNRTPLFNRSTQGNHNAAITPESVTKHNVAINENMSPFVVKQPNFESAQSTNYTTGRYNRPQKNSTQDTIVETEEDCAPSSLISEQHAEETLHSTNDVETNTTTNNEGISGLSSLNHLAKIVQSQNETILKLKEEMKKIRLENEQLRSEKADSELKYSKLIHDNEEIAEELKECKTALKTLREQQQDDVTQQQVHCATLQAHQLVLEDMHELADRLNAKVAVALSESLTK